MKKPNIKEDLIQFYKNHSSSDLIFNREELMKLKDRNWFKYYFVDFFSSQNNFKINKQMFENYDNQSNVVIGFKSGFIYTEKVSVDLMNEIEYDYKKISKDNYWDWIKHNTPLASVRFGLQKEKELHSELGNIINLHFKNVALFNKEKKKSALIKFENKKQEILSVYDNDANGTIDLIEQKAFNDLLKKHEKKIIKIDRNYVHNFIKISSYLSVKSENLQSIFSIVSKSNKTDFQNLYEILQNEIHIYKLLLYNSLLMITSLVNDDMITFFKIYEAFDTLSIFNSNWEKELKSNLSNLKNEIVSLRSEIDEISEQIQDGFSALSAEIDFNNQQLEMELASVKSSLNTSSAFTGLNTYKLYK